MTGTDVPLEALPCGCAPVVSAREDGRPCVRIAFCRIHRGALDLLAASEHAIEAARALCPSCGTRMDRALGPLRAAVTRTRMG